MSSIMMDRWGLDCAIDYLQYGNKEPYKEEYIYRRYLVPYIYYHYLTPDIMELKGENSIDDLMQQCWDNFLTAIVLWDEIWSSKFKYNWKDILHDTTAPVNELDNIIHLVDSSVLTPKLQRLYDELRMEPPDSNFIASYWSTPLLKRTNYYQILSFSLGIPYLAHPYRINSGFEDQSTFNRNNIIDQVDKELERYYFEVKEKWGLKALNFKYPVLIDYIVKDAASPKEELLAALSLRKDPDIVDFRESMYEIEQSILRGDRALVDQVLQRISDLAKEITTKHKRKGITGEFTLSIGGPGLTFPFQLKAKNDNKLHVTFIRKLLDYGVHRRQRDF